ncbi:hypothetical protein AAG906_029268 [Vitis piasezkii]
MMLTTTLLHHHLHLLHLLLLLLYPLTSTTSKPASNNHLNPLANLLHYSPPPPHPHLPLFPPKSLHLKKSEKISLSSAPDPLSPILHPRSNPLHHPPFHFKNSTSAMSFPNPKIPQGKLSFDAIRESLKQLQPSSSAEGGQTKGKTDVLSLSAFQDSLRLRPVDSGATKSSVVIGGSDDALPMSVFGKDIRDRKEAESTAMKTSFVKWYGPEELGKKLRELRPETGAESCFSLKELNERLMKLREMEEKETESSISGVSYKDLRESLVRLRMADDEKTKKSSIQRLDILGRLGGTPSFMLAPPKEHLVEQYFHPDNMSSAEKLKVELKKVRDEFKMSESDCGSARVQVAQLTTKIKHLNSALHKKDKHSRKGLQAMVQRRKKLLKYLRRTDWDSYCLVLSKLGLRDNPNYKN